MQNNSKLKTTLGVVLIAVVLIVSVKAYFKSNQPVLEEMQKTKGPKDAPITIVEFIDFQCPACAAGSKYLHDFMEKNPTLVRLEMKYYPLTMHQHALLAAKYSECALQQGQFWPYHDQLIDNQEKWAKMMSARPAFDLIASELEMDEEELAECLDDEKVAAAIQEDKATGKLLGVQSTPTYVVNGKIVVGMKSLTDELEAQQKILTGDK